MRANLSSAGPPVLAADFVKRAVALRYVREIQALFAGTIRGQFKIAGELLDSRKLKVREIEVTCVPITGPELDDHDRVIWHGNWQHRRVLELVKAGVLQARHPEMGVRAIGDRSQRLRYKGARLTIGCEVERG